MDLQNNNIKLLLIGTGPDETEVKDMIKAYDIEKDVKILGVRNDIERYYQTMDLFLFPSTYEGLGMVAIEAQISGLDCIASDVVPRETKITDLIQYISLQEEIHTWIEAVLKCKEQAKVRHSHIKEAQKEGYDIKEEAKKLQNLYIKMVEEG